MEEQQVYDGPEVVPVTDEIDQELLDGALVERNQAAQQFEHWQKVYETANNAYVRVMNATMRRYKVTAENYTMRSSSEFVRIDVDQQRQTEMHNHSHGHDHVESGHVH